MFHAFCFCYVSKHFPFYGGITSIYLKYVEYSGIFFLYLFVFFCHVLHIFLFYGGKTRHSNGKLSANHHLEEHHLANGEMSACRETPSWKEKTPAQNGKPQPHAALYACIYIYIHIARI
jgi:hypothetical protein